MNTPRDLLDELGKITKAAFLVSEDWSRLSEIGRRVLISKRMRRDLPEFRVILVSGNIEENPENPCSLGLYISPRPEAIFRTKTERELETLIRDLESMRAYIDGLDDALPGEMEE